MHSLYDWTRRTLLLEHLRVSDRSLASSSGPRDIVSRSANDALSMDNVDTS
jgi:hypothetical protein